MDKKLSKNDIVFYELSSNEHAYSFDLTISQAIEEAENEVEFIQESIESIKMLKPDCDKMDYILAASFGALCGIMDIFLVGVPKDSSMVRITDNWVNDRVKDFARFKLPFSKKKVWKGNDLKSAIRFLERKYKVPYDQTGIHDAAKDVFDIHTTNHHFKSLSHNPTICGLVFSILDQFNHTSTFVTNNELIILEKVGDRFELKGENILSKIFCGFVNWIGHMMSDVSGSSKSKNRGSGIPSPIWAWINDIIVIKNKLNIPVSQFDKYFSELAVEVFKEGYDIRFQTAQLIPVIINELLVKTMYSFRRCLKYIEEKKDSNINVKEMFEYSSRFGNVSINRLLTIAHGSFCIIDIGDATIRARITHDVKEIFMRINICGIGRFTVSLYGEINCEIQSLKNDKEIRYYSNKKVIIDNYISGLKVLSSKYCDKDLLLFVNDFENSELYIEGFKKSIELAELREVPSERILRTKGDIDKYFTGGK